MRVRHNIPRPKRDETLGRAARRKNKYLLLIIDKKQEQKILLHSRTGASTCHYIVIVGYAYYARDDRH